MISIHEAKAKRKVVRVGSAQTDANEIFVSYNYAHAKEKEMHNSFLSVRIKRLCEVNHSSSSFQCK